MSGGIHKWGRALVLFLILVGFGAWPSDRVALAFSSAYCRIANVIVGSQTFGRGGHARLIPADRLHREPSDVITADAAVLLTVDGLQGDLRFGISLRRDVYLPLLLLLGATLAAPLSLARRLQSAGIGVPVMGLIGAANIGILAAWIFATKLKGLYDGRETTKALLELALRRHPGSAGESLHRPDRFGARPRRMAGLAPAPTGWAASRAAIGW